MKTLLLLVSFLTISTPAHAWDVFGNDNVFIKVQLNSAKTAASFEICSLIDRTKCLPIGEPDHGGKPNFYSISDIQDQHVIENWQIAGSIFGDLAAGTALTVTGGAAGLALGGALSSAGTIYLTLGLSVAGGGSTIVAAQFLDPLNPMEQWRQARVSRDDVITDKDVKVDSAVADFARSLDTVLRKLKPVNP